MCKLYYSTEVFLQPCLYRNVLAQIQTHSIISDHISSTWWVVGGASEGCYNWQQAAGGGTTQPDHYPKDYFCVGPFTIICAHAQKAEHGGELSHVVHLS